MEETTFEVYCPRIKKNYFCTNPLQKGRRVEFRDVMNNQIVSFQSGLFMRMDDDTLLYSGDGVITFERGRN
jgi:hypothetical protein